MITFRQNKVGITWAMALMSGSKKYFLWLMKRYLTSTGSNSSRIKSNMSFTRGRLTCCSPFPWKGLLWAVFSPNRYLSLRYRLYSFGIVNITIPPFFTTLLISLSSALELNRCSNTSLQMTMSKERLLNGILPLFRSHLIVAYFDQSRLMYSMPFGSFVPRMPFPPPTSSNLPLRPPIISRMILSLSIRLFAPKDPVGAFGTNRVFERIREAVRFQNPLPAIIEYDIPAIPSVPFRKALDSE